jgi:hypothetical protein
MFRLFGLPVGVGMVLAFAGVAAAAKTTPVDTPKQAIAIGIKACDKSWGAYQKRMGNKWKADPKLWNAKQDGDYWAVWMGDEKKPSMHIKVARDGRPPDPFKDCFMTITS